MRQRTVLVNRREWQGLFVVAALALAACGGDSPPAPEAYRVPVSLSEAHRADVRVTSEVVGTLAPWREVAVAAETTGTVSRLDVELGDAVREGAVLFCLDPTDADLAVAQAAANLESAQATRREAEASHARVQRMASEAVASEQDLDSATRALDVAAAAERQAEVRLQQARETHGDCTVESPISGEVTRRLIEIGESLAVGEPAIELADLSRVKLMAEVSERERVSLREGASVAVRVDVLGDEIFAGTIHALGARADARTLTFPIEIAIDNADGRLLAGMIARAALVLAERPAALVVPLGARVVTIAGEGVFTTVTGADGSPQARFVAVEFGDRHGEIIEVLSGLDEGTPVVSRGVEGLRDGVAIRAAGGG